MPDGWFLGFIKHQLPITHHQIMKQEDKLSDLFRNNQHKLEEMPSPQSWDTLRKRLDRRKRPRRSFTIYNMFAMVAAAVGLVLIATMVFNLPNPIKKKAYAMQEIPNYPPELLQKAIDEHRFRTYHQEILQQHIEEGNPSKLLVNKKESRPLLIPKKKQSAKTVRNM